MPSEWLQKIIDQSQKAGGKLMEAGQRGLDIGIGRPPAPAQREPVGALVADQAMELEAAQQGGGPDIKTRALANLATFQDAKLQYYRDRYGADNVKPVIDSQGTLRNVILRENGRTFVADPRGFELGDIADYSGDVIEAAGGLAGAALASRLGMGRGGAALVEGAGDIIGSAARQGLAGALIGEQAPAAERVKAGAINVGAGQVGNVMQGAAALAGDFAPRAVGGGGVTPTGRAITRFQREAASDLEKESLQSASDESVRSFYERSLELEERFNRQLSKAGHEPTFRFLDHQARGAPSAAKMWETVKQRADMGADRAIKEELRQMRNMSRVLDSLSGAVVKNPEMLDNLTVADQLGNVMRKAEETARSVRARAVNPMYEAAEALAKDAPIFGLTPVLEKVQQITDANPGTAFAKYAQRKTREFIGDVTDEEMQMARYATMKSMRAHWSAVARGAQQIPNTSPPQSKWVGREMLRSIDSAMLESSENNALAGAVRDGLLEANKAWAEYSKSVDDFQKPHIATILDRIASSKGETVVDAVRGMSKEAVRGIAHIANKTPEGQEAVAGLYVQSLRNAFEKAGFDPERPAGAQLAKQAPSANKAITAAVKDAKQLNAMLEVLPETHAGDLRDFLEGLDRIATSPRFSGSPTYGYLSASALMDLVRGAGAKQLLGKATELVAMAAETKANTSEVMFELLARPEGAAAYGKLMREISRPNKRGAFAKRSAREAIRAMSQILVLSERLPNAAPLEGPTQ